MPEVLTQKRLDFAISMSLALKKVPSHDSNVCVWRYGAANDH